MSKYKHGDVIQLKRGARPLLSIGADEFEPDKDGKFWGLPIEAFDFEYPDVYLKSEYASKLWWNVDEVVNDMLNINVAFDDYYGVVNPGAFCSYVSIDDVCDENEEE